MAIETSQINFFLERIRNADTKTFESAIRHLFSYLGKEASNNPVYLQYESDRKTKWSMWPGQPNMSNDEMILSYQNWKLPDDYEETKSLVYDLYKTISERKDVGINFTFALFRNPNLLQNIYLFNNAFFPYFIKAIDDIINQQQQ